MSIISNISSNMQNIKPYIWLAIAALSTVLLQYFLGIKYSPDSNWYLIFSDQIGSGLSFDRLAPFAPLYYWSLGLLKFFGLSTVGSILIYWWISYFITVTILFSIIRNISISILGLIAILSNPTTFSLYRYVWTELGYSVILIAAIYSLYQILTGEEKNKYRILFLISISILPIQKYIGAYISVYLGLIYLFLNRKYIFNRLLELIVATLPLIFVISWNLLLTGHISGPRRPGVYTLFENFDLAIKVIYHYFRLEWILLFISILLLLYSMIKKRTFSPFMLLLIIPIIQFVFQIISSSIYRFDTINPRFFIVLTPTIILLLALFSKQFFKQKQAYTVGSLIMVFTVLIGLNASYGNYKRYPYFKKQSSYAYKKVRNFLLKIEDSSVIGVYKINYIQTYSEYILDPKIIPPTHCQNYHVVGYFRNNEISFMPSCRIRTGHTYLPIKTKNKLDMQYILVSKKKLPKKWKDMFVNYNSIDLGPFYGLTRK